MSLAQRLGCDCLAQRRMTEWNISTCTDVPSSNFLTRKRARMFVGEKERKKILEDGWGGDRPTVCGGSGKKN